MSEQILAQVEEWRPIIGYETTFAVSNLGRIKRTKDAGCGRAGKIRKQVPNDRGYLTVILADDKRRKSFRVNRLVAMAFIPNPLNLPEVNHLDGDKTNNRVDNLEWSTRSRNMKHACATGLIDRAGESHPRAILTDAKIVEIRRSAKKVREIAVEYGIATVTVYGIRSRRAWAHVPD